MESASEEPTPVKRGAKCKPTEELEGQYNDKRPSRDNLVVFGPIRIATFYKKIQSASNVLLESSDRCYQSMVPYQAIDQWKDRLLREPCIFPAVGTAVGPRHRRHRIWLCWGFERL